MKRGNKVVLGIVAVSVALCMGVSLAACSSAGEHDHSWNSGEVTVEATCTTNGLKTYTCTGCGQQKTEKIAATGHNYKEQVLDPTCEGAGYSVWICEACGALDTTKSSITDANGHTYDQGAVTTAATCTTAGEMTYTCSVCKATKTQVISALGHDYEVTSTTAPSCTLKGEVTYTCSRCDATYTEVGEVPTGHTLDLDNGVLAEDGSVIYTCTICGEKVVKEGYDVDGSLDDIEVTTRTEDDGSTVEVYSVDSAEDLANIAAYVNGAASASEDASMSDAVIELTDDIDLEGTPWTPIGSATLSDDGYIDTDEDSDPEYAFSGTFDGNGYTISNLRVDSDSCAGLFGYLKDGTVQNVTIENATINGGQGVGIIAGDCDDNTDRTTLDNISNVRITGLVQVTGTHFVGGIAGRIESTDIENCSIIADEGSYIKGIYEKEDYEGDAVGGIAGYMGVKESQGYQTSDGTDNASHIWDVTVSGLTISGSRKVGGIVGNAYIDETDYAFVSSASYVPSTDDETDDNEAATTAVTDAIVGNTVSDCTISLTYVTKDDYTSDKIGGSRLFVGAILGELTTASKTVTSGKITDTTVSGVTVNFIDEDCIYGGAKDVTYRGFYGGSRDGFTITFDNCEGSVTCVNSDGIESDSSWQESTGSETVDGETVDVYEVSTVEQFINFSEYVNSSDSDSDMSNAKIELTEDIDLADVEWTPIGDTEFNKDGFDATYDPEEDIAFCGTFDGQGHTISNLTIDAEDDNPVYAGLFGYIYGATIENVNIENATVTGEQSVGVIVGTSCDNNDNVQDTIYNCHVTGLVQVEGNHFVGGICGRAEATVIKDCSIDADEGSYVKGTYLKDDYEGDAVGGIIGYLEYTGASESVRASHIMDVSVNGLDISGTRKVGGIVGGVSFTTNPADGYAFITSAAEDGSGNSVTNCNISITAVEGYSESKSSNLYVGAILGEVTEHDITITDCTVENVMINAYNLEAVYGGNGNTDGNSLAGFYGGSRQNKEVTLKDCAGEADIAWIGTASSNITTYTITTAEQLCSLSDYVNDGNTLSGYTIKLGADIDLEGIDWTPIGYYVSGDDHPFSGTFDGNEYTIYNLTVSVPEDETAATHLGFALFGRTTSATITNVTLENVSITGTEDVAAIVGYCTSTTISNCTVTGLIQIEGNYDVGGIAGDALASSIINCSVIGSGSGESYIKGVYGGDDLEADNVGGIVGFSGEDNEHIMDVTVSGIAISGSRKVGGFVGSTNDGGTIDGGFKITTATETDEEGNVTVTGAGNYLTDVTISIIYVEDYTASKQTMIGATIGETVSADASVSYVTIDSVTVNYYSLGTDSVSYVFPGTTDEDTQETDTTYAGWYGGSRGSYTVAIDEDTCKGSVTIQQIEIPESSSTDTSEDTTD